ncbi:hypothetical protein [Modestobacter sp. VKM Ac-2985]|uniref:hypothetical protein n=1 Tax=Modestobacter sp. VKM Ac-2985 TaxID=3004139 RepID=UPI0022AB78AF|nr:hypothetical protein [Modestobacter sp. VKM Ac-2985]MCZ2837146.1 hypothetical protein [Modestobacter sp. VKM Ac-2985]
MSAGSLPCSHPRTGDPLRPIGFRKNGRAIWPILGAADDAPDISKRPDGVPEDAWNALGDPGKAAIVREREARSSAERARDEAAQARTAAEQALAAAKASTKQDPPKTDATKTATGDQVDVAEQIRLGIEAAMAPYRERDEQREATEAAQKVRDAVTRAAGERFHDAGDAVSQLDLTTLIDDQGRVDTAKVDTALGELLGRKPYLGKAVDHRRRAPDGSLIGGGGGGAASLADRVKAQLALMNDGQPSQ